MVVSACVLAALEQLQSQVVQADRRPSALPTPVQAVLYLCALAVHLLAAVVPLW
jgi:hypothetical protein